MGSLTTCDPGDIMTTIQSCKDANLRCSVISLAAEVRVYKKLAKDTDGAFSVSLDDVHLRDLLQDHIEPPPSTMGAEPSLIKMGFPSHASSETASLGLCMCHLDTSKGCKLTTSGFLCPQVRVENLLKMAPKNSNFSFQCQAKYCELPVECKACGLTLVSAPHLARSYHHLFPLPGFNEVNSHSLFGFLTGNGNRFVYRFLKLIQRLKIVLLALGLLKPRETPICMNALTATTFSAVIVIFSFMKPCIHVLDVRALLN